MLWNKMKSIHPFLSHRCTTILLFLMASLNSSNGTLSKMTKLALIFILLSSPTYLASKSVGFEVDGRRLNLGSRPPRCADKCSDCRPCTAAIVVSPNAYETAIVRDETYHLLSWKCQCGSKYYQP